MPSWSDVGKTALAKATGSIEKAVLYVNIDEKLGMKHKYIVKYNPSTLRLVARAGKFRNSAVGAMGMNQITQMNISGQVQLDVDIIVEDLNNMDAFMKDKNPTNVGTVQAVTSSVAGMMKATKGGYSIQDQVEAFLGLLISKEYRVAEFCWGKMSFKGEITSVDAQYTMFNPVGHPVRAVIHLSMQQNAGSDNVKIDEKYWEDALNALFPRGSESQIDETLGQAIKYKDVDAREASSFVQNLLNF